MSAIQYSRVGGVVSADIAVPDHANEVRFYASVLTTGDAPLWREDLSNNIGMPIIGLGERVPAYDALPLQWMPHIQVADVGASAARAVETGGQEVMHGKDDNGESQWAVLTDPAGAAFGIIPVVMNAPETPSDARIGCIAGLSLHVEAAEAISAFYTNVAGWSPTTDGPRRLMHAANGALAATIQTATAADERHRNAWILHLPVDDLTASLDRVRDGGGEVLRESAGDEPAVIQDPVGVVFGLQSAAPADAAR